MTIKLNVGAGKVKLEGWTSVDLTEVADVQMDVTKERLPFADQEVSCVYSEHFIEHITDKEGRAFVKESHRVLASGGLIRVATPDLEYVAKKYLSPQWREQEWLTWPQYRYVKTRCKMFNTSMREWGHQYLYDGEELTALLAAAGFTSLQRKSFGESSFEELQNLETRKDSLLIIEGIKR